MSVLPKVAALEGWFTLDEKEPQLLGSRCRACNTCYFPKQTSYCRNPACDSSEFDEVPLSRRGRALDTPQPGEKAITAMPSMPA